MMYPPSGRCHRPVSFSNAGLGVAAAFGTTAGGAGLTAFAPPKANGGHDGNRYHEGC